MVLKPWIGATFVKKDFDLVHRFAGSEVGRKRSRQVGELSTFPCKVAKPIGVNEGAGSPRFLFSEDARDDSSVPRVSLQRREPMNKRDGIYWRDDIVSRSKCSQLVGIGASVSTTYAGYLSDHFVSPFAFLGLTAFDVIGLAAMWALMPETGQVREGRAQGARMD
jgi:hypothetical protein